jgi:hypothetical protein
MTKEEALKAVEDLRSQLVTNTKEYKDNVEEITTWARNKGKNIKGYFNRKTGLKVKTWADEKLLPLESTTQSLYIDAAAMGKEARTVMNELRAGILWLVAYCKGEEEKWFSLYNKVTIAKHNDGVRVSWKDSVDDLNLDDLMANTTSDVPPPKQHYPISEDTSEYEPVRDGTFESTPTLTIHSQQQQVQPVSVSEVTWQESLREWLNNAGPNNKKFKLTDMALSDGDLLGLNVAVSHHSDTIVNVAQGDKTQIYLFYNPTLAQQLKQE